MGTLKMDAGVVRAAANRVRDGADRLDGIRWTTDASDALIGSTVAAAIAAPAVQDRLADVVIKLHTWATAARAAAAAVESAESRSAERLGEPR